MAHIKILTKKNIDNLTRKIPYWKKLIGMRIVGMPKEPLSIVYWKKEKDQILAKSKPIIKKKGRPIRLKGVSKQALDP
jgi:hypothetical protein